MSKVHAAPDEQYFEEMEAEPTGPDLREDTPYVWYWEEDAHLLENHKFWDKQGNFVAYPPKVSTYLEAQFQSGKSADALEITYKTYNAKTGYSYSVDFREMKQINKGTGYRRTIMRRQNPHYRPAAVPEEAAPVMGVGVVVMVVGEEAPLVGEAAPQYDAMAREATARGDKLLAELYVNVARKEAWRFELETLSKVPQTAAQAADRCVHPRGSRAAPDPPIRAAPRRFEAPPRACAARARDARNADADARPPSQHLGAREEGIRERPVHGGLRGTRESVYETAKERRRM